MCIKKYMIYYKLAYHRKWVTKLWTLSCLSITEYPILPLNQWFIVLTRLLSLFLRSLPEVHTACMFTFKSVWNRAANTNYIPTLQWNHQLLILLNLKASPIACQIFSIDYFLLYIKGHRRQVLKRCFLSLNTKFVH